MWKVLFLLTLVVYHSYGGDSSSDSSSSEEEFEARISNDTDEYVNKVLDGVRHRLRDGVELHHISVRHGRLTHGHLGGLTNFSVVDTTEATTKERDYLWRTLDHSSLQVEFTSPHGHRLTADVSSLLVDLKWRISRRRVSLDDVRAGPAVGVSVSEGNTTTSHVGDLTAYTKNKLPSVVKKVVEKAVEKEMRKLHN